MRKIFTAAAAGLTLVGGTLAISQSADAQTRGQHARSYSGYHGGYSGRRDYRPNYSRSYYNRGYYGRGYYGGYRGGYYRPGVSISLGYPGYYGYGGYGYGGYYPSYGYGYSSYYPSYGYGCARTVWRVTPRGRIRVNQRYC